MSEIYVKCAALAARFEVSKASIWRWCRDGDFPKPVRLSDGCTRWKVSEVDAWVMARETEAAA